MIYNLISLNNRLLILEVEPRGDNLSIDAGIVPIVETEETDEASSSVLPMTPLNRLEAVELCLFFLGIEGRIFPGNSVRNLL